jgi:predicted Zn-dependent peptidase
VQFAQKVSIFATLKLLDIMKKLTFLFLLFATAFWSCKDHSAAKETVYETVANDPLGVRIYTLQNGLKVYLSVNKDEPRVYTSIAVRTGSKNDPADCTGLAHYLEHMLFKGTSHFATTDWEKEKVLLQQISDLYELHKNTADQNEKNKIYRQIDSISLIASEYAVANEYDKMVSSLGAQGTNAYTSNDQTVYINDIPANEIEKWLVLESERFSELVLRLFHTELEAVYEEYNRGLDSDFRKSYYKVFEMLFPTHPYGTQTTIGLGEHLKNPSMKRIHEYFDTYYVPNNMAICISGDIDFEKTIQMVEKHFGKLKNKEVKSKEVPQEAPITEVKTAEVFGPNAEWVNIGFRMGGARSEDELYMTLINNILYNGQAGLMDLNLVQKQKVLNAYAFFNTMNDYSVFMFNGNPKGGQKVEEVKDLMLAELDKIKRGEFDESLIKAVIRNLRLEQERYAESNNMRVSQMVDAFIADEKWENMVNKLAKIEKITKDQIVAFANKNFGNNYAVVYKRTGSDPSIVRVEKPQITPIKIDRDKQSTFAMKFDSIKTERVSPVFVDFKTAIKTGNINNKVQLQYVKNNTNSIFSLYYVIDRGSIDDREMELAVKYLKFLGTSKYSNEDLQKEFYKLGLTFDVYASNDRMYVSLSGLDESFEEGVKLFEHLLSDPQANEPALKELIADIQKSRIDNKKNKGAILQGAMLNYAKFGKENPYNTILTDAQLNAVSSSKLIENIKKITAFEHKINYYGSLDQNKVTNVLTANHILPETMIPLPPRKDFKELDMAKNTVYFADYDMVQTEMVLIHRESSFNKDLMPAANVFNNYFGSGLSSIVFQEIRESKALAYAAFAAFQTPQRADKSNYVFAYIGTQVDKLPDATKAMNELMNNMPEAPRQFNDVKTSALKSIETERIIKESIFWTYDRYQRLGFDYDIRQDEYKAIQSLTINDLKSFFDNHIKGKSYTYCVIGNKKNVNMEALKSLGETKELKLTEIFGY